jgi:hypothetical protein
MVYWKRKIRRASSVILILLGASCYESKENNNNEEDIGEEVKRNYNAVIRLEEERCRCGDCSDGYVGGIEYPEDDVVEEMWDCWESAYKIDAEPAYEFLICATRKYEETETCLRDVEDCDAEDLRLCEEKYYEGIDCPNMSEDVLRALSDCW